MSEQPDDQFGWFAYSPIDGQHDAASASVRDVHLSADEYAGPFWSSEGSMGPDYEDVHTEIGISRALYDDVMAWNDAALTPGADTKAVFKRQQDLLRRLADEVAPEVDVPEPRSMPAIAVSLLEDDITALSVPEPLAEDVLAWRRDAVRYAHANGDNDADI